MQSDLRSAPYRLEEVHWRDEPTVSCKIKRICWSSKEIRRGQKCNRSVCGNLQRKTIMGKNKNFSTRRKLVSEKGVGSNVDWMVWKHKLQPRTRRKYESMAVVSISSSNPNPIRPVPHQHFIALLCLYFSFFLQFLSDIRSEALNFMPDHVPYNNLFMSKCVK